MAKKRLLAVVMVVVLLFVVACSNNNNTPSQTPGGGDSATTSGNGQAGSGEQTGITYPNQDKYEEGAYTLPIVSEPLELVWMGRDAEDAGKSFLTHESIIWTENEKNTGISIKWDVVPNSEYQETMQMRLASGRDLPDILAIVGTADGSHLVKYAEDGLLMPLNDLIDRYAPNLKRMFEENPAFLRGSTLPDGTIRSLGNLMNSKFLTRGVSVRKDWLDELGLQPPTTPDELLDVARAFVNNDPNRNNKKDEYGIMTVSWGEYRQLGMMFGLSLVTGSGWSVRDGVVTYEYTLPAYKAYLEWMHQAYSEGLIPRDFQTSTRAIMNERDFANQLGIKARENVHQHIVFNDPNGTVKQNTPEAIWMPLNFKDSGYGVAYPTEHTANIWRSYGITSNAKDPIAAIRLLDYIMAGEGRFDNVNGIEGLTYNMVNGKPLQVPNVQEVIGPTRFLGGNFGPRIIDDNDTTNLFELQYMQDDPEMREWSIRVAEEAAANAYVPFMPAIPSIEEADRITKLYSDLDTYRDEMFIKFVTGQESLDNFDRYVEQMKSLGYEEIAAIYQAGYDRQQAAQ